MRSYLSIVLLLISTYCFTQDVNYEILMGRAEKFSLKNSSVWVPKFHGCGGSGVTVRSNTSTVFSITDGKVRAVFNLSEKAFAVVIKGSDSNFYAYSSFDTIYVHTEDSVDKGSIVGKVAESTDEKIFEITIIIADKDGNYLKEDKIWEIIEKSNSIPIAAVCDATVINSTTKAGNINNTYIINE